MGTETSTVPIYCTGEIGSLGSHCQIPQSMLSGQKTKIFQRNLLYVLYICKKYIINTHLLKYCS